MTPNMHSGASSVTTGNYSRANWAGNRLKRSIDLVDQDGKTLRQQYLIGDPQDCPAGTTEELKKMGLVGIYYASQPVVRNSYSGYSATSIGTGTRVR